MPKPLTIGVNSGSDYSITDNAGRTYTPKEAKDAFEGGKFKDYNLAFWRLATQFDYDIEKLKAFFVENP